MKTAQTFPFLFLPMLAAMLLLSCASARRSEPFGEPLDRSDSVLVRGEEVFMQRCNKCHPHGESGLGPSISNKTIAPAFAMRFQVRHGLGVMPSFSDEQIPPEDLDAIIKYLSAVEHNKLRER